MCLRRSGDGKQILSQFRRPSEHTISFEFIEGLLCSDQIPKRAEDRKSFQRSCMHPQAPASRPESQRASEPCIHIHEHIHVHIQIHSSLSLALSLFRMSSKQCTSADFAAERHVTPPSARTRPHGRSGCSACTGARKIGSSQPARPAPKLVAPAPQAIETRPEQPSNTAASLNRLMR